MSKGVLDRSRFEAIEAYVLGAMSADERARFEAELTNDGALRAELELQRENIMAVELGGVTRTLRSIAVEDVQDSAQGTKSGWPKYLKYAAVVAIILSGTLWLLRPSANERLFAEYFVADPGLPVAMGSTDDPVFADAMVSYKEGDFAEARAKWEPLLQQEPGNDTLRYYMASARLAEGDARAAIPMLEALASEPRSVFHARANWFLFLAYVHAGQFDKAQAIQLESDTAYGERVRSIKAQLTD